jgi:hypothetical protein
MRLPRKVNIPFFQSEVVMTSDMIDEQQDLLNRLGNDSHEAKVTRINAKFGFIAALMQSFKAANPGCIFEDFVRWHFPDEWTINPLLNSCQCAGSLICCADETDSNVSCCENDGILSTRLQDANHIYRRLWNGVKSLPMIKQTPLFDYAAESERILHYMQSIDPHVLCYQISMIALGNGIASLYHSIPAQVVYRSHPLASKHVRDRSQSKSKSHSNPSMDESGSKTKHPSHATASSLSSTKSNTSNTFFQQQRYHQEHQHQHQQSQGRGSHSTHSNHPNQHIVRGLPSFKSLLSLITPYLRMEHVEDAVFHLFAIAELHMSRASSLLYMFKNNTHCLDVIDKLMFQSLHPRVHHVLNSIVIATETETEITSSSIPSTSKLSTSFTYTNNQRSFSIHDDQSSSSSASHPSAFSQFKEPLSPSFSSSLSPLEKGVLLQTSEQLISFFHIIERGLEIASSFRPNFSDLHPSQYLKRTQNSFFLPKPDSTEYTLVKAIPLYASYDHQSMLKSISGRGGYGFNNSSFNNHMQDPRKIKSNEIVNESSMYSHRMYVCKQDGEFIVASAHSNPI